MHYYGGMPSTKIAQPGSSLPSPVLTACPVERAVHVIGGKWKLLLLRSLLLNGPQGYNQLLASVGGISSKELTRNLKELVESSLICRGHGTPVKTGPYSLTKPGKKLMPIFKALLTWGQHSLPSA
jgi:DNA-binding HxlR family transcriptional regulator